MSAKTIKEEGSHARPEGERKDVLLDHNYDGIQEYD
ncbi:MAG TPA: cytochrome C oxidase subunit III, partial [Planctomycetes bacterium]|nr:cytochrome C oxidase subunit III [Planctomycetota bacterium]